MQSDELILYVRASAHFEGGAEQDADFAPAHFGEQFFFLRFIVRLMDKGDFFGGNGEVCRQTGLTKKAIEYYEAQMLIKPTVLDNGYRDYQTRDIERLREISVLRAC